MSCVTDVTAAQSIRDSYLEGEACNCMHPCQNENVVVKAWKTPCKTFEVDFEVQLYVRRDF